MSEEFWNLDGNPNEQGWYAVIVCYDEQEDSFPRAAYWGGSAWTERSVVAFGEKRATKDAAKRLALAHDPDA